MSRKSIRLNVTLWMCGAVVSAGLTVAAELPGYHVFVTQAPVSNFAIQPGKPLPSIWQEGTTLQVTACRNEREPASFVIQTEQPLRKVDIRVGKLRGDGASIPAEAVDVRVAVPCFRRVTSFPATLNWVLLHDPDLLKIAAQTDPDVLKSKNPNVNAYVKTLAFTREPIDTPRLRPADIDDRRQSWLRRRPCALWHPSSSATGPPP